MSFEEPDNVSDLPYFPPAAPPPMPVPRGPRSKVLRVAAVASLAVVVALAGALAGRVSISDSGPSRPKAPAPATSPGGGSAAPGDVAPKVDPAVVDVDSLLGVLGGAAAGTGMVLTSSGEILTNNHVVEEATSIKVTDIGNGRTYDATVVGTDKAADVAVLQLSGASGLATVRLADSSRVGIGEAVMAIGNAGGGGGTPIVTTGQVHALAQGIVASDEVDKSQEELTGLIQTDATL